MFWKDWSPIDWVFHVVIAVFIVAVVGLTTLAVVVEVQHPRQYQGPPPSGQRRVCTTVLIPVSNGKSTILIPVQRCHNEPNPPTTKPTK
jgi:hypothetical protein